MNSKLFSEILDDFKLASTKAERLDVLRKNDSERFREFLVLAFIKDIEFDVEIPDYRPSKDPAGLNYMYLQNEVRKLYRFIKGHPQRAPGLVGKKQSNLLMQLLESLYKDEAELLVNLFKKDLKVPFLTAKLIKEAYPNINIQD
jgi:hypothetical protein